MNVPLDNTAARIERSLTAAILRGEHPIGARLPTVRALAARFDVNPATVQRAVARLERTGLVTARQGSGIVVNDPEEVGDVSLVPAWLDALEGQPARAAAILEDFLEVRRILAARLIVRHRRRLEERATQLAEAAERVAAAPPGDLEAVRDADLAFARALLRATGNTVAMAVLNTAARLVIEVPDVARAMYGEPARNARSMATVLAALSSGANEAALAAAVEEAIAGVDRDTVARFRRLREEASR